MNKIQGWGLRIKQQYNEWRYCYWECAPVDDGSWWRSRSGNIVLTEPKPCAKCGTMLGVDEDGEA